jgi:2-keto-4-pentenoate hydratase
VKENPSDRCASLLAQAEASRQPGAPLTELYPNLALRDAYAVQQLNIERRLKAGETIRGHKIGLTARAMQIKFGVNEPDYGHLLNTMFIADHGELDLSALIDPQIEVEPAFVLKSRLMGPNLTAEAVLAATDYVCVCFEVIDSRIEDWRIKLQDTVADNGSSALVALSEKRIRPDRVVLDDLDTLLEFDGRVVETGNSKDILGHPANGIAWLGNALAPYGIALEAGHVVLPGTCTKSRRVIGTKNIRGYMQGLGEVVLNIVGKPTVTKFAS